MKPVSLFSTVSFNVYRAKNMRFGRYPNFPNKMFSAQHSLTNTEQKTWQCAFARIYFENNFCAAFVNKYCAENAITASFTCSFLKCVEIYCAVFGIKCVHKKHRRAAPKIFLRIMMFWREILIDFFANHVKKKFSTTMIWQSESHFPI